MNKLPIKTKIFIDGGDPQETRKARELLGYIDGQTTNPTLIYKNPEVQQRLSRGEKLTKSEALAFYKKVVSDIAQITSGPISIEVYADKDTNADQMLTQARELVTWTKNAYIKFPTTSEGLKAASIACQKFPINMTLCFSQEQAAAVYAATHSTRSGQAKYPVFVSPFIGRLDDIGINGMDVIKNILAMYKKGDGHVKVLTASVRNVAHILYAIKLKSPALTIPFKIFKEWADAGFALPDEKFEYQPVGKRIPYKRVPLNKNWQEYDIYHELTDAGIKKFSDDWSALTI